MDGGSQHCTEGSDQNHPKEKEIQKKKREKNIYKKAKWFFSEETLQIAEKRIEAKGKGERE